MLNPRTRCREIALQLLYMAEQNDTLDGYAAQRFIARRLRDRKLHDTVIEIVDGVQRHQEELDELISRLAQNWSLERMAAIDRNILRLGTYEMLHCPQIPPKVAINEAVEMAKRYSTAQSSRFVNGILNQIFQHHLPGGSTDTDPPAGDAPAEGAPAEVPAEGPPAEGPPAEPTIEAAATEEAQGQRFGDRVPDDPEAAATATEEAPPAPAEPAPTERTEEGAP